MKMRTKVWLAFGGIVVLMGLAVLVDLPKGPDITLGSYFKEIKVHLGLDLKGGVALTYDADVSQISVDQQTEALEGVRDVIERRVNAFGISEPVIQTVVSAGVNRVLVELPGLTDVDAAIQQIGETPLLEFKEQGQPEQYSEEQIQTIQAINQQKKQQAIELIGRLKVGEDFVALANQLSEDPGNTDVEGNKLGGDLGYARQGQFVKKFDEVLFETGAVGEVYPEVVETQFGYHVIQVLDKRTIQEDGQDRVEVHARHILLQKIPEEPQSTGGGFVSTGLTGTQLKQAAVVFDPNTNEPQVSLQFDSEGTDLFAEITKRNLGQPVAIELDGQIISAPTVQAEITTGEAVITGDFTIDEAKEMVKRLNAGALPVPITLVSQYQIGPSLGQIAVERSLFAGLIGLVALAIFMLAYYRLPGLLAVFALACYAGLALALFKLWPITLTLAGIAGFILSIGMAVDANILVFERLKEEIQSGKPISVAREDAFKRAWLSIRDSNFSSLITCIILYWFGSSLIRGFALTLALGILVSMFTAIIITRNFLRLIPANHPKWFGVKNV
ncbi:MAG: protein translocase subunit SecD [Patescibacteria group bacterium]